MTNDMITEDYVSFETAKLLKDKGFNVPIYTKIHKEFKDERPDAFIWRSERKENFNDTRSEGFYSCPTIQMAMKWLREVHHLFIQIEYECEDCFVSDIYSMTDYDEYGGHKHYPPTFVNCKTYEQACEVAVKHCLEKLI